MKTTKPIQSGPWALGLRDSATFRTVITSAAIPIGMLTKKIHRHDNDETSTPPTTGPTATATPVIEPQMPNAMPRSLPWKALASRASETVNMMAPPTPCRPRLSCSTRVFWAMPHSMEARVKTTRPTM